MKLIIENFRKFLIEELSIGISQEINDEVLDKVFEWAGVTDRSSIKHLGSASMGSAYKINSKDFGEVVLKSDQLRTRPPKCLQGLQSWKAAG